MPHAPRPDSHGGASPMRCSAPRSAARWSIEWSSSASTWRPGSPMLSLADTSLLKARVLLDPREAIDVTVGSRATISVYARPDEVFTGRVVRVGEVIDPRTRRLPVEIELDDHGGRLRPGLVAKFEVVTGEPKIGDPSAARRRFRAFWQPASVRHRGWNRPAPRRRARFGRCGLRSNSARRRAWRDRRHQGRDPGGRWLESPSRAARRRPASRPPSKPRNHEHPRLRRSTARARQSRGDLSGAGRGDGDERDAPGVPADASNRLGKRHDDLRRCVAGGNRAAGHNPDRERGRRRR